MIDNKANTVTITLAMYEGMRRHAEVQQDAIKELTDNIDKLSVSYKHNDLRTGLPLTTFKYEGKDEVIKTLIKEKEIAEGRADRLSSYLATRASRRERRRFITKGEIWSHMFT